jgi:LysR family transcriptional regulator of abg operon
MTAPLKLSQLRHLVAVTEAGSLRQAARQLFLSQSSITKSIQQLEQSIGVELLQRTAQGVVPTNAGRALIGRAVAIENELREARNDIDDLLGLGSGEVRIAASPTVATSLLPRTVVEFKKQRPKATLQLHEAVYPEVLLKIRKGDFDFAVCLVADWVEDETVSFEILVKDRVVPAVRAGHPLERRRMTLTELLSADWVIYRRGRSGRDVFEQTFIAAGLEPPRSTIECSSFTCLRSLIERGDYVTLLPHRMLLDPTLRRSLSPIDMQSDMPSWNVAIVYRAQQEMSPLCKTFLETLRAVAARSSASHEAPVRS